ncbi:uncharacterized protein LOC135157867 [Lytechinus pictus]|uniref:uncharacterized protein LOC135157867 n=1 Tax=Lytechinus pictus TaxID=7653 RepID=UPI0030BA21BF
MATINQDLTNGTDPPNGETCNATAMTADNPLSSEDIILQTLKEGIGTPDEAQGSSGSIQQSQRTVSPDNPAGSSDNILEGNWEMDAESNLELRGTEQNQKPTPRVFTAGEGEIGGYHGESHLSMRMSSACKGPLKDVDKDHPQIWALLPKDYDYHICAIEIPDPDKPDQFKIGFRLPIKTEKEMDRWIEEYQKVSYTQYRVGRGNRKSKAVRILYQRHLKCQHNIIPRKKGETPKRSLTDRSSAWRGPQHTGCQAKLNIAIRVYIKEISKNRLSRNRDVHMPNYPAMISITHIHNHETKSKYALRFRPVDKTMEEFYTDLFKAGHSALTAWSFFQWKRWAEYGIDYERMVMDRAYNPDMAYVYRIFYRMIRERKPHLMKPVKSSKQRSVGMVQTSTPATLGATTLGVSSTSGLTNGGLPNGLGTEVIMEGDEGEGDVPQTKRMKLDVGGNRVIEADVIKDNSNSGIIFMETSSVMASSGLLSSTTLNNSNQESETFAEEEILEEEEEDSKDFFAHGFRTRIRGKNLKRKNLVNLKELYEDLEQLISKHVNEVHPAHAHLARITGDRDDMIIAICTPLMRRAHGNLPAAGELCILDGTYQSFGQVMCYVVSFMVPTNAGGIPLGFLVLSSMDQVFITQGLELFKMLIPDDAFGCRGRDGPSFFLTDEEHFKLEVVQATFPNANVLISPYHLITMTWRWMADPKRRIQTKHHAAIFGFVKDLVNSQSAEELNSIHVQILNSEVNKTYREFAPFVIAGIVNRWNEWMLPDNHPIHTMGVGSCPWQKVMNCMRDRVLMKGRHFNILQMTHFLLNGVDRAYQTNLEEGCKNDPSDLSFTPIFLDPYITKTGITQLSPTEYHVNPRNKNLFGVLTVNIEFGVCSCIAGRAGYYCVHLASVYKFFNVPITSRAPFELSEEKNRIYKLATGKKIIHEQLLDTMQQLAQVVEANMSTLKEPIKHFIEQIERADSASGLVTALEKFQVLTKEEEEEAKDRMEREKVEKAEEARREEAKRREEEEQRRRAEERVKEEQQRMEEEEEKKRKEEEKQKEEEKKRKKVERLSWLFSENTNLDVKTIVSSEKVPDKKVTEAEAGKKPRTPIMTPGRAVTRGVTRVQDSENKKKTPAKRLAKSRRTQSPSKQAVQAAKTYIDSLEEENAKDKNLIMLMTDEGGMLVKGTVAEMASLGRVLVINKPITDQQVGMVVMKDKKKGKKKGKS